MENDDEFVDIIGYEGLYQINRKGEVLGLKRNKILKPKIDGGYSRITLCKEKQLKTYLIHRLLAIQFIPNPENLSQIDHIDRNKQNNNLANLRWSNCQSNNRNTKHIYDAKGCIYISKKMKKGDYFTAEYYIDYQMRKRKNSYNLDELEKWLEEMRIQYPRI